MDVGMDKETAPVALQLVAQGVIGKRVDEMESGFMLAIDYMINQAKKDNDEQVLDKMPSSVQLHITCHEELHDNMREINYTGLQLNGSRAKLSK